MKRDITQKAFFALVQGGLWDRDVTLQQYGDIDFNEIMRLSEEQAVLGLVTAGLEHVKDIKVPKEIALQFIGQTLQLEQRNIAMNAFIGEVIELMGNGGVNTFLIKGQGVAQCYDRPLWRSSGDVDLLMDDDNYQKGKILLKEISDTTPEENLYSKEYIATVNGWYLELHGSIRCGLSRKMDKTLDAIISEICNNNKIRFWDDNGVLVSLVDVNNDIIIVFTHFVKHFYKGGLGVRQICDWCRMIWAYKDTIDVTLLEKRLYSIHLMTEWKSFAAFAVHILGMPSESMPFYSMEDKWLQKSDLIKDYVLEVGNFGYNRESSSYENKTFFNRKCISLLNRCSDLLRHMRIFPVETLIFTPFIFYNGFKSALRGE